MRFVDQLPGGGHRPTLRAEPGGGDCVIGGRWEGRHQPCAAGYNYAQYTPFTPSPPSNATGPVIIPGGSSGTTLCSVYLDFDNSTCVSGTGCKNGLSSCSCSMHAYRAPCATAATCPAYSPGSPAFTKLATTDATGASYVTKTVSSTSTHFHYKDDGAIVGNLAYGKIYTYVVTNVYDADTTATESGPSTPTRATTPLHMAVLNYSSAWCNSTTQACVLQIYRTICGTATSCPAYIPGDAQWTKLNMTTGLTTTVTAQGTTWRYSDMDPALAGSTTYAWIATSSFQGSTTASPASAAFTGTTVK